MLFKAPREIDGHTADSETIPCLHVSVNAGLSQSAQRKASLSLGVVAGMLCRLETRFNGSEGTCSFPTGFTELAVLSCHQLDYTHRTKCSGNREKTEHCLVFDWSTLSGLSIEL